MSPGHLFLLLTIIDASDPASDPAPDFRAELWGRKRKCVGTFLRDLRRASRPCNSTRREEESKTASAAICGQTPFCETGVWRGLKRPCCKIDHRVSPHAGAGADRNCDDATAHDVSSRTVLPAMPPRTCRILAFPYHSKHANFPVRATKL